LRDGGIFIVEEAFNADQELLNNIGGSYLIRNESKVCSITSKR
jgi:hypothetical protein